MLTEMYDMKIEAAKANFETRLPKSFIGCLMRALKELDVEVIDIHDEGKETVIKTSLCTVRMEGTWSVVEFKRVLRNEYYRFLNERFDERVQMLRKKGYKFYKEYGCYALSETSARNHSGIPLGVIMHQHDFLFSFNFD